uniref:Nucleotide-diphospho-sugar transferase domain-containing protein n=1 Tax=viral metagenome TaxID=1070528 RepID=A0A6C0H5X4_9ZZZZ
MNVIFFMKSYLQKNIIEYFPSNDTTFWIPIYDTNESRIIQDFILFYFENRNFNFIQIDNYQSVSSSIAHTLLQIHKEMNNNPFFIYNSDVILNPICYDLNSNYIHTNINASFNNYLGICFINDSVIFWDKLNKLYKENKLNPNLNELMVLKEMSINYIVSNNFLKHEFDNDILFFENEKENEEYVYENKNDLVKYSIYFCKKKLI